MQKNSSACTHSTLPACPQWPFLYAFVQKNMMHFCLHNKSIPIKLCQTIQHMMIFCHLHPKHHLHLYIESFLFVCLFSTVMTSPGPALQECTGSCYENVPAQKAVSSVCDVDRWSDCIGQDRDSSHLGTLTTILLHFTHTQ